VRNNAPNRPMKPRRKPKRKVCFFTLQKIDFIDYKNVTLLRRIVCERGKILPRRTTGTNARYQRSLAQAIKRAREIALLPFVAEPGN